MLASMGWQLLNSNDSKITSSGGGEHDTDDSTEEKTFYPFTFPLTVGPGCLAIVITFSAHLGHDSIFTFTEHMAEIAGIFGICVTV